MLYQIFVVLKMGNHVFFSTDWSWIQISLKPIAFIIAYNVPDLLPPKITYEILIFTIDRNGSVPEIM